MSKKTKQLLDNLNKITEKPRNRFEGKPVLPDTNRMWKSAHESGITPLPKSYEPIKWNKEVDADGNIDYWTPFDRVYGGIGVNAQRVIQKDGTTYQGKLHKKRRLIKSKNILGEEKNFYSTCTVTADGRWFDNGGFPIDPPKQEDQQEEEQKEEIGFARRELTEEEKAEQVKWQQRAESDMLKKLK